MGFSKNNPSFKIAMSGRAVSSQVYLFFSYMLPLFFSGLLPYLVGMKRGPVGMSHTRETTLTFFIIYPESEVYLLINLFSKLYVTFILHWIAVIFGRDKEEDQ